MAEEVLEAEVQPQVEEIKPIEAKESAVNKVGTTQKINIDFSAFEYMKPYFPVLG